MANVSVQSTISTRLSGSGKYWKSEGAGKSRRTKSQRKRRSQKGTQSPFLPSPQIKPGNLSEFTLQMRDGLSAARHDQRHVVGLFALAEVLHLRNDSHRASRRLVCSNKLSWQRSAGLPQTLRLLHWAQPRKFHRCRSAEHRRERVAVRPRCSPTARTIPGRWPSPPVARLRHRA